MYDDDSDSDYDNTSKNVNVHMAPRGYYSDSDENMYFDDL